MSESPFRRLLHWGPISVLCIIKLITWAMVHVIGMWWPPHVSLGALLHSVLYLGLASGTLYYFLQALLEGPGFVPLGWKPKNEEDTQYLQFCTVCKGYKAPRSHHCRKCGYCVKKMDHHCPWINCCVGHANHGYFVVFLAFAVLGCLQATVVLIICIYHGVHRAWYVHHGTGREPMVHLTLTTLLLVLLAIGMALGVVLAVGGLLYLQIKSILRNQTTIEDWIVEKAAARREDCGLPPLRFPYDLGRRGNVRAFLRAGHWDGIQWPLRDGCEEYDLTIEQRAQKADKRTRARLFVATADYDGRWLPLASRPRAALAAPCSDEPRLPLARGDRVSVTRQRRHWMFGEKLVPGAERGARGWLPRACVAPAARDEGKPD